MNQNHCPLWAMSWQYRRQKLIREIAGYQADVVCLQEVQINHYHNFLKRAMEEHGYSGLFKAKTCEVCAGDEYVTDGCATFFRSDRFSCVKKYEVEFKKAAKSTAKHCVEPQKSIIEQRLSKASC